VKASICIATHDKAHYLALTLDGIYRQKVPFDFEIIVVDDGSPNLDTAALCANYPGDQLRYSRIDRKPGFQNQARPRNVAYKMATGDVIISQSDDVVHVTPDCIERLVNDLTPGHFLMANVINTDEAGKPVLSYGITEYIGPSRQKPLFFLGSLFRKDVYAVGGCDEEFMIAPAYEDDWFGDCLIHGLGLIGVYSTAIVGHHLDHPRTTNPINTDPSCQLYKRKLRSARKGETPWCATGGPWEGTQTKYV
jgi:glycosyltransferase involved in cell wall biosynthesis